jgi:hypothetical protein
MHDVRHNVLHNVLYNVRHNVLHDLWNGMGFTFAADVWSAPHLHASVGLLTTTNTVGAAVSTAQYTAPCTATHVARCNA